MRVSKIAGLVGMVLAVSLVVACGGGGGGGTGTGTGTGPSTGTGTGTGTDTGTASKLALMVDSLGRSVPEADFGGGGNDAAGADGTAGDGAPIANAVVTLKDAAGHTATATTDAQGYYRIRIDGFTPPFVAQVAKADGTVWYSPSVSPVVKRGFVTINLTGLTDKVTNSIADAANVIGGAAAITPNDVALTAQALAAAKTKLSTALTSPLTYVGLNPYVFDPVASPYAAIKTDNYDRLLDRLTAKKDQTTGNTVSVGTFAGVREGFLNGEASLATFDLPRDVAVDSSGNKYVADVTNHAIRKITPAGVVITLAGSGSSGFSNGTGTAATFSAPSGVAVDGSGNVYVADGNNYAIRKITPAGVVSTIAGSRSPGFTNGTGTAATFYLPRGVAVDGSGNVYVGDAGNNAIRKITPAGVVSTLAGSGSLGFGNGTGTAATFSAPNGVAVDGSGSVYVADTGNNAIRKITPAGVVSTLAGSVSSGFTNGTGTAATFYYPSDVAVDNSGNVYVAEFGNNAIRKITPAGVVSTLAGSGSPGFTNGTGTAATFTSPYGVAVDGSGNVYVADVTNHAIRKITPAGVVSTLAGSGSLGFSNGTGTAATFDGPYGVAADGSGNVYVADLGNHAIRKITPAGVVSKDAGDGVQGYRNSSNSVARSALPSGVAVSSSGVVYVGDTHNHAIRLVIP